MFRRFMQGRYGNDQLNLTILVMSLVFALLTMLTRGVTNYVFSTLQLMALIVWALRTFSKNHYNRRKENQVFLKYWYKLKNSGFSKAFGKWGREIKGFFQRLSDREHKYFKCPVCGSRLRVPRGRGEITVTCPKCRTKFDQKS